MTIQLLNLISLEIEICFQLEPALIHVNYFTFSWLVVVSLFSVEHILTNFDQFFVYCISKQLQYKDSEY